MKVFEGVYGNDIARERSRSRLPAKIAYWATILFLDALTLTAFAVGSWALGNALFA